MNTDDLLSVSSLNPSLDDLKACGFEAVIARCEPTHQAYNLALSEAGKAAITAGETAKGQALGMLAAACQAMLKASDPKAPFRPLFEFPGRRGVVPADFKAEAVDLLVAFSESVQDQELAARLADIGWSVRRNVDAARRAITAYSASADSPHCKGHWPARVERLERALRIARMIRVEDAVTEPILSALESYLTPSPSGGVARGAVRAGRLLLEMQRDKARQIASGALTCASYLRSSDAHFARDMALLAAKALRAANENDDALAAELQAADLLLEVAAQHERAGQMMVAAHWMARGVSALQQLPGQADRVRSLQVELERLNRESLKEMKPFRVDFDASQFATRAEQAVRSASAVESLLRFAFITGPFSRDKIEKLVTEAAPKSPFANLAPRSYFNGDGRLIAIAPPLLGCSDEDYPAALKALTHRALSLNHEQMVAGVILPARDELWRIHPLTREQVAEIFAGSPLFPVGHEELWIHGLYAGLAGDFDVALSLLVPQFEHALRKLLEARGVIVWKIDPATSLHTERTLSDLLDTPEAEQFLGRDMQYELQMLLTERLGDNLRNELAHGLLPRNGFFTAAAIYLWWLLFDLAAATRHRKPPIEPQEPAGPAAGDQAP
jgi:hypothetical protein